MPRAGNQGQSGHLVLNVGVPKECGPREPSEEGFVCLFVYQSYRSEHRGLGSTARSDSSKTISLSLFLLHPSAGSSLFSLLHCSPAEVWVESLARPTSTQRLIPQPLDGCRA